MLSITETPMPKPHGYYVAGSGWRRTYANERNANRAFTRLMNKGYECGVVRDSIGYAVLVSRYSHATRSQVVEESPQ